MQRFPRFFAAIAVAVATLASVARAQLVTYETISQYSNSNIAFQTGTALTQTFTNVTQIQSMTFRFLAAGGSSTATTLNYYFTEWNATTNRAVGSAIQSGSISILASSDNSIQAGGSNWQGYVNAFSSPYTGLDWQFNLNANVDHNTTYAFVLVGTTSGSNVSLLNVDNGDNFTFGQNFRTGSISTNLSAGYTGLTNTSPSSMYGSDWGFSQIVVAPYIAPVPEASTIAILFAAVFIAFLVGMRLRQRRLALATAAAIPVA